MFTNTLEKKGRFLHFTALYTSFFYFCCYCTNHSNFLGEKGLILNQGWGAGAGCFWLLGAGAGAAWKKNLEPEPLWKKIRSRSRIRLKKKSGAGAAKKIVGSPALPSTPLPVLGHVTEKYVLYHFPNQ